MSITEQIHTLHRTLPTGTTLVAVSKFHPVEALREAYDAGQRIFGESRVQELLDKKEIMPKDIEWHFIGHLQQNKVKYIVPFVSLIHGVDSPQLFREIDKQGRRFERRVPCLLQLHVAREESKFGFSPNDAQAFLQSEDWRGLSHVELRGIMCMASFTDDVDLIRREFYSRTRLFPLGTPNVFFDFTGVQHLLLGHDARLSASTRIRQQYGAHRHPNFLVNASIKARQPLQLIECSLAIY